MPFVARSRPSLLREAGPGGRKESISAGGGLGCFLIGGHTPGPNKLPTQCGFLCTSVGTSSKCNVETVDIGHALQGPEVRLPTRQQAIAATLVRCGGPRISDIEPMENLNHQNASMKASTTKGTRDLEELVLLASQLEAILKNKMCVKILGALR